MNLDISSIPGVAAIFVGLAVFFALYAILAPVKKKKVEIQDEILGVQENYVPDDAVGKYVRPILNNFLPQLPFNHLSSARRKSLSELIIKSGNPWKVTPEEFVGLQIALALGAFLIGAGIGFLGLLPSQVPPYVAPIFLAILGFLFPYGRYDSKRQDRAKQIQKELPEALELLMVSISSGQTFEPALRSVTSQLPEGLLKDELTKVNIELQAGSTLERTLTSFYKSNDAAEAESFARAVIMNQKLGSDVSETLTQQAEFARSTHAGRIEKMIARLESTMMITILATMMPAFLAIFTVPILASLQGTLL